MTKLCTILGWLTIVYGLGLAAADITAPAALALLAGLAAACCIAGAIEDREKRSRAQVARIIERSRAR